jgi:hypothetical protein
MEVASDSTWDCIMQKLSQPIIANKNYKMSFWLAASKNYPHLIDNKGLITENKPAFLQIWVLNLQDGLSELLYSTSEVTNAQWEKQEIAFSPMLDYDHIQFKPCYAQEGEVYNGNILLDNLSAIEYIGE